jgi:AraC family transcriptional regulator of adaptative response / DNA-3-methyladenine glycosylase II
VQGAHAAARELPLLWPRRPGRKRGLSPLPALPPELAPQALAWSIQDASAILARQAARLLDEPDAWAGEAPTVERLAARLGVSDRHVRRIFEAQLGVSPCSTCRRAAC